MATTKNILLLYARHLPLVGWLFIFTDIYTLCSRLYIENWKYNSQSFSYVAENLAVSCRIYNRIALLANKTDIFSLSIIFYLSFIELKIMKT